jgi:hypothetical protein
MAKFITGKELEDAVYNIIWDAKEILLIVSPYVKLDNYFIRLFENHLNNPSLHLLLVFGKNEGNIGRSLGKNDIDFFKKFPNISVIYIPNLHAKYYGNESAGVITSINLYDYSFKNNIEFGVYSETGILNAISKSSDQQAWNKSMEIAESGEAVFIRRPVFQRKLLSVITGGKNYMRSDILLDNTDFFYSPNAKKQQTNKRLNDYPEHIDFEQAAGARPTREEVEKKVTGYCIRTGVEIPFDPTHPLCPEAYKSWAVYKNLDFKEKFCHKTGERSNGKTSMRNPIMQ